MMKLMNLIKVMNFSGGGRSKFFDFGDARGSVLALCRPVVRSDSVQTALSLSESQLTSAVCRSARGELLARTCIVSAASSSGTRRADAAPIKASAAATRNATR